MSDDTDIIRSLIAYRDALPEGDSAKALIRRSISEIERLRNEMREASTIIKAGLDKLNAGRRQ